MRVSGSRQFAAWLQADPTFRQELLESPGHAVARRHIPIEPDELRPLWDPAARGLVDLDLEKEPTLRAFLADLSRREQRTASAMEAAEPSHERLRIWWRRQRQRAQNQLGWNVSRHIVHGPAAIELSRGCSVGCWFCGVSAEKLSGHFRRTPENSALFRDVLEVIRSYWGATAAALTLCYWATDPLDNPDYTDFLGDYQAVLGGLPQTTTALALKHPDRVRTLLGLDRLHGRFGIRLSILSLGMLRKVYDTYSPAEMEQMVCLALNRESAAEKAVAGRRVGDQPSDAAVQNDDVRDTIACVSGLLVNMVERSVKLISPTAADERWPLGYWVWEESHFADAADLSDIVASMIERHMRPAVDVEDRIRLLAGTRIEQTSEGATIVAPRRRFQLRATHLAESLASGERTAGEIALGLYASEGKEPYETFRELNDIRGYGLLDEEPSPSAQAREEPL